MILSTLSLQQSPNKAALLHGLGQEPNIGKGNRIGNVAGMNQGPGVGTGDGPELAEGPGVMTGEGLDLDKGTADGVGLRSRPSNGMST